MEMSNKAGGAREERPSPAGQERKNDAPDEAREWFFERLAELRIG